MKTSDSCQEVDHHEWRSTLPVTYQRLAIIHVMDGKLFHSVIDWRCHLYRPTKSHHYYSLRKICHAVQMS